MQTRLLRLHLRPWDRRVERLAWFACLVLPLALLHARAAAEMLIVAIDAAFLAHCWIRRDEGWLRTPFALSAAFWWAWIVLCSCLNGRGVALALAAVRLPLLSLALGSWLLAAPPRQRLAWWLLVAAFVWIGAECWQQYILGTNLFGLPRFADGALTGPFNKPRAGPAFILLFFPVLVPGALALLRRGRVTGPLLALAAVALASPTMVLIGQRMPTALMLLGFSATALLIPRLRLAMLIACVAGAVMVVGLQAVSPAAHDKLVVQTSDQLRHFGESEYGLVFNRAIGVAQAHPWIGLGFDGFRFACAREIAIPKLKDVLPSREVRACNLHPHNYYLEAADNGGWPGLLVFTLMAGTALAALARDTRPAGAGLFVGALVALWPLASTSAFTSMPNGGWIFFLLGLGFAQGRSAGRDGGRQEFA